MSRFGASLLAALMLTLAACAKKSETPSAQIPDTTHTPPDTTAHPRVKLVVSKLPDNIQGLEIADGGLRVKDGFKAVKESDSTYAIVRMSDGQRFAKAGCVCDMGTGCIEVMDPIIRCRDLGFCPFCRTVLEAPDGVRTVIFEYRRQEAAK